MGRKRLSKKSNLEELKFYERPVKSKIWQKLLMHLNEAIRWVGVPAPNQEPQIGLLHEGLSLKWT